MTQKIYKRNRTDEVNEVDEELRRQNKEIVRLQKELVEVVLFKDFIRTHLGDSVVRRNGESEDK